LTPEQATRLSETPVGHLATADANGRPHVIPVCFAYDGQYIYSVLDAKPKRGSLTGLRRVRNILANPQVSLVIDHYDEDWTRLWYLLVQGRAELIESGAEPADAVSLLRSKYPQYRKMDLDGNPVIKITPERATGWSGG
jgi:PPOX class probable F420-dependent enzyme